jgi:hypothetical protein
MIFESRQKESFCRDFFFYFGCNLIQARHFMKKYILSTFITSLLSFSFCALAEEDYRPVISCRGLNSPSVSVEVFQRLGNGLPVVNHLNSTLYYTVIKDNRKLVFESMNTTLSKSRGSFHVSDIFELAPIGDSWFLTLDNDQGFSTQELKCRKFYSP